MAKVFRGGVLNDTALLAREAIQNSTDARSVSAKAREEAPLRVTFRFVHLFDGEKESAISALDLRGLADLREAYEDDPLQPGSALDTLDDPRVPLTLLFVEDFGTHGLFGSIHIGKKSHLFKAMYYLGSSDKAADAGGSYGFGKSALMRASRVRSVLAHSVFEAFDDDPVRERLVGFTWWPDLQERDNLWKGRLSFASHRTLGGQHVEEPFEDDEAANLARLIGFQARDRNERGDTGTSFLIVDPAIDAVELKTEIEKWWWPALEENRLDVKVALPNGEDLVPRPASNPFVSQFLKAFRIATGVDEAVDTNRERLASGDWRDRDGVGGRDLGSFGLTVIEQEADAADDELEIAPLVALTRGPRMVIKYAKVGRSRAPLRGVFVASDKIDHLLRETEPSSHDQWTTNESADLSKQATDTAGAVLKKIRDSVRRMANEIAPAPPRTNRSLAPFAKLMSGFLGNRRGPTASPKPGGEKIELQFPAGRPSPTPVDEVNVMIKTTFTLRAASDSPGSQCEVTVTCPLLIHEDESPSHASWPVTLTALSPDSGFTQNDDGSWSGTLTRDSAVLFDVTSAPYPNVWTTSLQPRATRNGEWSEV